MTTDVLLEPEDGDDLVSGDVRSLKTLLIAFPIFRKTPGDCLAEAVVVEVGGGL